MLFARAAGATLRAAARAAAPAVPRAAAAAGTTPPASARAFASSAAGGSVSVSAPLAVWHAPALRHLSSSSSAASSTAPPAPPPPPPSSSAAAASRRAGRGGGGGGGRAGALAAARRGGDDITDVIPPKPVGVVEGAGYTVVIVAGVAFAAAVLYAAASELLIQPVEYAAFNAALDRVRDDPRVAVRLGTPITGYGSEGRSRAARQRVPHRVRTDDAGVDHVTVQFWARGPRGAARVTAEASAGAGGRGAWSVESMVADFDGPHAARVTLVSRSGRP